MKCETLLDKTELSQKLLLSEKEARFYIGLGRSSTRELGKKIGAIRHCGRRILYMRKVFDDYFENENS